MSTKYTEESSELLGPGTDLIISLLGVLLLALAMYAAKDGSVVKIEKHQIETIKRITTRLNGNYQKITDSTGTKYHIYIDSDTAKDTADIIVSNDVTLQRITFGEKILFKKTQWKLLPKGETVISRFSSIIFETGSEIIEEIIIQGHTDIDGNDNENMLLGAKRAISVMNHLTSNDQLSPHEFLMSATSFGPYKPVQRKEGDTSWTKDRTLRANNSRIEKKLNRRIDIILNYSEDI